MERGKNPGDKDEQQQSKSPQKSKEQQKTMPNLKIKIPAEYLSERQKKLLSQKPQSKDKPSTSSEKKDDVFKVPWIPPLRKKKASPSKLSSYIASTPSSTAVPQTVQDASLEESTGPETVGDASLEESTVQETAGDASLQESTVHETAGDASLKEPTVPETVRDTSLDDDAKNETQDQNRN
ncbi:unnamed protein product [Larinioides sclopetarius]|uniref:Uncharacterized protein n=1 Tax=Larinioides sclopetarius TaxID=280406 RepID=A0AAV2AZN3_9ARAC